MKTIDPFKRVEKALSTFHKAMAELDVAANDHHAVADEAQRQIDDLALAAAKNRNAAYDAARRASKIAEFLA